ncbi:DUF5334 family protein [Pseudomonas putida]
MNNDGGKALSGDVEPICNYGSTVEMEVYAPDNGEYRTFEMDDD